MSKYFPTAAECSYPSPFPGVRLQTVGCEKMMLSLATLEAHSVVEDHSHPHEQVGMVFEGRVVFTIGGEEKTLGPGDMFCVPGNVVHRVVTLETRAKVLDIFCPIRDDYR